MSIEDTIPYIDDSQAETILNNEDETDVEISLQEETRPSNIQK